MVKRTGPTNVHLRGLIVELKKLSKKEKTPIWKTVAEKLSKPRRQRVEVNLAKINRHAADGETIVVPGVVLASGELNKAVSIAAWRFSAKAKDKIKRAKCKALTIEELIKQNPKGSKIKIMV